MMKDLCKTAAAAEENYRIARIEWQKAKSLLEKELIAYAKQKAKEVCLAYSLPADAFTICTLVSGSPNDSSFKIRAGHFGRINIFDKKNDVYDLDVTFVPTKNGTWLKVEYKNSFNKYATEVIDAPIPMKALEGLAKEMTEASGAEFELHKYDLTSEFTLNEYEEIKFLNGTIYQRPVREDSSYED